MQPEVAGRLEDVLVKPGSIVAGRFRLRAVLASRPPAYLVTEAGTRGRTAHVLKPLTVHGAGSLRDRLRPDFLDLASLVHPSLAVPSMIERDPATAQALLVRPYVQGTEIVEALGRLSVRDGLPFLAAAAESLALLHRFSIVHGDVKPSNFIVPRAALSSRGHRGPRVMLCDAAWWRPEETSDGRGVSGDERRDVASDLHALGRAFYRVLAGREPAPAEGGFPPPLREIEPAVPVDLERLVMKLLHPDRRRRYEESAAVAEDLRRIAGLEPAHDAPPECFLDRREDLERALRRLEARRPAAIAVSGEEGMGKTAFLRRLEIEAQVLGYRTVPVRCYPDPTVPSSTVRAIARGFVPHDGAGRDLGGRLRRLVGEAEEEVRPEVDAVEPDPDRRRIFIRAFLDLLALAGSSRPTLILLDDAHVLDPLTLDLLAGLVRDLAAPPAAPLSADPGPAGRKPGPAPPSLAVAFRAEAPFQPPLRPLLEALRSPGKDHIGIEIRALKEDALRSWLDLSLGDDPGKEEKLEAALRLGSRPFAVREVLRAGRPGPSPVAEHGDLAALHRDYVASLGSEERDILEVLATLGRPASPDALAAALGCPAAKVRKAAGALIRIGTLAEDAGLLVFRHGSFSHRLLESLDAGRRAALHRRIAAALEGRRGRAVEEVAHHWIESDRPADGLPTILDAARHLAAVHENGRALAFYEKALDLLRGGGDPPPREAPAARARRMKLIEEAAEAASRAGRHRRAAGLLEVLLEELGPPAAPGASPEENARERGRLHGRLGLVLHRAGEIPGATVRFEKALSLLPTGGGEEAFQDRMLFESELAEIASLQGDYAKAEAIALGALEKLGGREERREEPGIRRLEMILLETLAHLRLRRFDHAAARDLFEKSLRLASVLEARSEEALILNNLGILHNQENRFREAILCYRRAEEVAGPLGEDGTLANIHANLALLHAKTGDPEAAAESLRLAARLEGRCDSARTRFLRHHAAGIVDLHFGRHASAIDAFKAAIALGEELKDRFVVGFDFAYLGECHLFRGEEREARVAFDRSLAQGPTAAPILAAMVEARRAAIAALEGNFEETRRLASPALEGPGKDLAYLEASNRIFRGWALRLAGEREGAASALESARDSFSRWKVPANEIHAELELAALDADAGNAPRALERADGILKRFACGRGPLASPVLAARLLAYRARFLLEGAKPDYREAVSTIAEAESHLNGHRHPEVEELLAASRTRVRRACAGSPARRHVLDEAPRSPGPSFDLVEGLAVEARRLVRRLEDELGEERAASLRSHIGELEEKVREGRRTLEGMRPAEALAIRTGAILGGSAVLQDARRLIRQVSASALPVLVTGETGTGKELAARAIHGESPRRGGPFVSVNCAAIPHDLIEAELFGHARGAFTGAEEAREGLVASAAGGTFFFDEIAELPQALQAKILRLLDDRRLRPLGGEEETPVDVRFVFSTSRDLRALAGDGLFRNDLLYRIGAIEVSLPPLRERIEDLPELVESFRSQTGAAGIPRFGEDALRALAAHPWPGNVRELRAVVTRLVLTCAGVVKAEDVRAALAGAPASRLFSPAALRAWPLEKIKEQLEREYLIQLAEDLGGDLKAVIKALGITHQALYKKLKAIGIRPSDLKG